MNIPRFIDRIGNTPLIDLSRMVPDGSAHLYAKCEFLNPSFSLKDRMASHIITVAEQEGTLKKGDVIVCASSGNTGCSVAFLAQLRGYQAVIVTSERCSQEKISHIKSLNAEVIVVEHEIYMAYGRDYAKEHGYFDVDQYNNGRNPEAYYNTLGPEIWRETSGEVTHFVMTGSTFGCVSGTGRFLKECNSEIQVILADPQSSNIYDYYYQTDASSSTTADKYYGNSVGSIIEGAGKSEPTQCLDFSVIDEVVRVTDKEAVSTCHQLSKQEGLLVGGSSGVNVFGAQQIAQRLEPENVVVTILCDNGIKYLSKIYNDEFLRSRSLSASLAEIAN